MSELNSPVEYEIAIVGAGPAGLSAAIVLARARRKVVVLDHGQPRNYAALAVHCYLGMEGVSPAELRSRGRTEAQSYGVTFFDEEVFTLSCQPAKNPPRSSFSIVTSRQTIATRFVLLATGMRDVLPEITGLQTFYGRHVHHCPFCDGWEAQDKRLVALGNSDSVVILAMSLRSWSNRVAVCSNGTALDAHHHAFLARHGIGLHEKRISLLAGEGEKLERLHFEDGSMLECDSIFFTSGQQQSATLFKQLGCECDEKGAIRKGRNQCTSVPGVYTAGDADGETQFSVVAAAEGATAAVFIQHALTEEDYGIRDGVIP